MKVRSGLTEYSTVNFWGDLDGNLLNPADILENPDDVKRVQNAIAVIQEFRVACEEQIDGFTVVEEEGTLKSYFNK